MRVVITANGKGERMKGLSPLPKHHLYYKDKKIIDWLLEVFPEAEVLENRPSNSRRETLGYIKDYIDTLIVDCDIIPHRGKIDHMLSICPDNDWLTWFESNKKKYSSFVLGGGGHCIIKQASENTELSNCRCAGVYFVKSVSDLLIRMNSDSIAEAMIGATAGFTDNEITLGDPEDYYEALGIHNDPFTDHKIIFNKNSVIKFCKSGVGEGKWYSMAKDVFSVPVSHHADEEIIVTERIFPTTKPTAEDFIKIIGKLKQTVGEDYDFETYVKNITYPEYASVKTKSIQFPKHRSSFFHGDLSTHNVLKNSHVYLIDPNYKNIFGSWLTDAGKAFFSFVAYEQNYPEAKKISDHFGKDVINFAVAEGLRVCKYKPEYISIVNNIAELC